MDIQYLGENLLAGEIGNLLIITSFVSAFLASIFYFRSSDLSLEITVDKKLGRLFFRIHSVAILGVVGILFYLIYTHSFEYYYVWRHSSTDLPMRYIFSCFWEGQEGSTMLWAFWHMVLGNILIVVAKKWEGGVLTVISSAQFFLSLMLLGIYVFDIHIGSNPFLLLREHPDMVNLPFVTNPNYLEFVEGNGLNPLLQNYWMTIHPPTLFLGFASTIVPFAYAITAMRKKNFLDWVKPALPWAFFSVMILGTGILMGGAWAYEALSFGGFWAWDPVENSSLVPWLVMVGTAHLMLISKSRKKMMFSTFLFSILVFPLVTYSTYLTKSGILGETSVHSFADGQPGQLVIFLCFYVLVSIYYLVRNFKTITKGADEDTMMSRDFWMFIGSLVFAISAFQISISTSIPVINALFGTDLAPPSDPVPHYNSWQMPLAILVLLLIALTQFMKYKKTEGREFFRQILPPFLISIPATAAFAWYLEMSNAFFIIMLFAAFFAIFSNLHYFINLLKGKVMKGGSAIAHIGFALMLMGAMIANGEQEIISKNRSPVNINFEGNENANNENIMLMKHDTVLMGNYYVSYHQRRVDGKYVYFDIDYLKVNPQGDYVKQFTLSPFVQLNPQMGNVPEPDTKHFLTKDIFTHITYAELENLDPQLQNVYAEPDTVVLAVNDSMFSSNSIIVVESLREITNKDSLNLKENDIAIAARISAANLSGRKYYAEPVLVIRGNRLFSLDDDIDELGLRFSLRKIDPDTKKLTIHFSEKNANSSEFIIMQAIVFPYINILWIGIIIMAIGTIIAVINRIRQNKS